MPQLGEIKRARDIGKPDPRQSNKYVWEECPDCKKPRWVRFDVCGRKAGIPRICRSCVMKCNWAKGIYVVHERKRRLNNDGYVFCKVSKNDFFASMRTQSGRVLEHRLVMARHLGRCLHRWEIVHHKHTKYPAGSIEDKQDNRIENLQLVSDDRHKQITILETKIQQLEAEIVSLKTQLNNKESEMG